MPLTGYGDFASSTAGAWTNWTTTSSTTSTTTAATIIWYTWSQSATTTAGLQGAMGGIGGALGSALGVVHDDAPRQRARQLLKANLTLEQTKQLEDKGWFEVLGSLGKRYRVWQGQVRNVIRLGEDGKPIDRLCAHPAEDVPDEDAMLAQKLLLEVDEAAFSAIANRTAA